MGLRSEIGLPVMMFPPTAATFLICLPANHLNISTISTKTLVLYWGRASICWRQAFSIWLRVVAAPNLIPFSRTLMLVSSWTWSDQKDFKSITKYPTLLFSLDDATGTEHRIADRTFPGEACITGLKAHPICLEILNFIWSNIIPPWSKIFGSNIAVNF